MTRSTIRYGLAIAVVLPSALSLLFGRRLGIDLYILTFAAVLLASVLGGLGPGLLATSLAAVISYEVPFAHLSTDELRQLMIGGTLVSIGGMFHAARLRARERYETNLRLQQRIIEIADDERRRIGNDLHDGLGQHLTGISLLSETMAQQLAAGEQPDPANVETITRLVSEAVGITRDLAKSLSPVTLEHQGLVAAVEELAHTSSSLFGIRCTSICDQEHLALDRPRSLHIFRILQEAVNNAVRHGKARNIRIELNRDGKNLTVSIVDDGIGLSQKTTASPGFGLRIMQHRAKMLRATLTAKRAGPKGGTVVSFTCPLDEEATQD